MLGVAVNYPPSASSKDSPKSEQGEDDQFILQ